MDLPFLKIRGVHLHRLEFVFAVLLSFTLLHCQNFDDPSLEWDPTQNDSTLMALKTQEHYPVARKSILESFGSFGCVSCAYAEALLIPYINAELNAPGYNPNLIVVIYHIKFGTIQDPWVTAATQARYDASFSSSLPQATLNGSNAPYGIRETGVRYDQGEYDSLVYRIRNLAPLTYLDLLLDTVASTFDSTTGNRLVRFTVYNRDTVSRSALAFSVMAVKNRSVKFPLNPKPWEAIVAETTDKDIAGKPMTVTGLPPLTAKTFTAKLILGLESIKNPPPPDPENPADYGLVVVAKDGQGLVQNVVFSQYQPH